MWAAVQMCDIERWQEILERRQVLCDYNCNVWFYKLLFQKSDLSGKEMLEVNTMHQLCWHVEMRIQCNQLYWHVEMGTADEASNLWLLCLIVFLFHDAVWPCWDVTTMQPTVLIRWDGNTADEASNLWLLCFNVIFFMMLGDLVEMWLQCNQLCWHVEMGTADKASTLWLLCFNVIFFMMLGDLCGGFQL